MSAPLEGQSDLKSNTTPSTITPKKQNQGSSLDSGKTLDIAKKSLEGSPSSSEQTKEVTPHRGSLSSSLPATLIPTKEATDQMGKATLPTENHLPSPLSISSTLTQDIRPEMIDFSQASDKEIAAFLEANFVLVGGSMEKADLLSMIKQAQVVFLCETHTNINHREKNGALIDALAPRVVKEGKEMIVLGEGTTIIPGERQLEFVRTPHIAVASWDNIKGPQSESIRNVSNIAQISQRLIRDIFDKPSSSTKKDVEDQCKAAINWLEATIEHCAFDEDYVDIAKAKIALIENKMANSKITPIQARNLLVQTISTLMILSSGTAVEKFQANIKLAQAARQSSLVTNIQAYKKKYALMAVIGGTSHFDPNSATEGMDKKQITNLYEKLTNEGISYITLSPFRKINKPSSLPPESSHLDFAQGISTPLSSPQLSQINTPKPVTSSPSLPKTLLEAQPEYEMLMKDIPPLRKEILELPPDTFKNSTKAVQTVIKFLDLLQKEHKLAILEENYPALAPKPSKPPSSTGDCVLS